MSSQSNKRKAKADSVESRARPPQPRAPFAGTIAELKAALLKDPTISVVTIKVSSNFCMPVLSLIELRGLLKKYHIKWLDISNQAIGLSDTHVKILCAIIRENTTIGHINLSGNQLMSRDCVTPSIRNMLEVTLALTENKTIQHLDLSNNHLRGCCLDLIGHLIRSNRNISYLVLGGNQIDNQGIEPVISALADNKTLGFLDLFGTAIDKTVVRAIGVILKKNESLFESSRTDQQE